MPKRPENALPKPQRFRNSLVVYVDKKRVVFGNYNDPTAWKKFTDFCEQRQNVASESLASTSPPTGELLSPGSFGIPRSMPPNGGNSALIADLVTQFLEFAQGTKNPSDFSNYKKAGQALWQYKTLPTAEFDAFLLLQAQNGFVKADYARTHCNKLVNFCIHMFRWGEVRRLAPPGKSRELQAIEPLRNGATRENEDRMPVDDTVVERTLPYLLPVYQAFIRILRSTGARPSEICRMKVSDIDRTDPKIWVYRLKHHKTMQYNQKRVLAFGRKDQALLLPYLDKEPNAAVFSPKDAISEHRKLRRDKRTTPITSSQKRDERRKQHPQGKFNEHFTVGTIGLALQRAIEKANRGLPPSPLTSLYETGFSLFKEC